MQQNKILHAVVFLNNFYLLKEKGNNAPFSCFFNKKQATIEAHNSPIGKEIQTPFTPIDGIRLKIRLRGIVRMNWRSKEIIRDSFPFPMASKVPEKIMPMVEIKNPRLIIRRAVLPADNKEESD